MSKLEKAILTLRQLESRGEEMHPVIGGVPLLLSVFLFLIVILLFPVTALSKILWMGVWLVMGSAWLGISYLSLLKKALPVIPFIALIGIFNPLIDRQPALYLFSIPISYGWLSFIGILVRGIFCVQAVLILILSTGFRNVCICLGRIGVPSFLTNQLLMVYRYLTVLLEEALIMRRARESRGYGRAKMPLGEWGPFIGQLFLRSLTRSQNIHKAMLSRGYNGKIPVFSHGNLKWNMQDIIWLIITIGYFVAVFFFFK